MRFLLGAVAFGVIGGLSYSQDVDDLKTIQGKWYLVHLEARGLTVFPSKKEKGRKKPSLVVFKNSEMFIDDELVGTISLDPKKTPKELDCKFKDDVTLGIYNLEQDSLMICWSNNPKGNVVERPKEFKTDVNKPVDRFFTLKRTMQ